MSDDKELRERLYKLAADAGAGDITFVDLDRLANDPGRVVKPHRSGGGRCYVHGTENPCGYCESQLDEPRRPFTLMGASQNASDVSAAPAVEGEGQDDEETYQLGKRDGYEEAVQDIDVLTGGDGEYRYCTDGDPDRHTPDAATMKQRIADRFAALRAQLAEYEQEFDRLNHGLTAAGQNLAHEKVLNDKLLAQLAERDEQLALSEKTLIQMTQRLHAVADERNLYSRGVDALRTQLTAAEARERELVAERDEWAAKWQKIRTELAELKFPGMTGQVRATGDDTAIAAGRREG